MAKLKRDLVKYVRDRAKAKYIKGSSCEICGSTEDLDFHHFNSVSELLHKWIRKQKLNILTVEDIMEHRDTFIEQHLSEMYDETATLCHNCHLKLHSIYGRNPSLATAKKQARWVNRQREKHGLVS
jgi:hypothetical protein